MNLQIANPIYDTVFKYIMHDSKIAGALLSAIIGEKIVELEFSATEYTLRDDADLSELNRTLEQIAVCRIDFKAKIETGTGHKIVTIELQKAKLDTDIMRFRRYLGVMYQDPENACDKDKVKPRQIYCIYFLNYDVGFSNCPVLEVNNVVTDVATGEKLENTSEFVAGLHHRSWIVQIRQLKEKRRNALENLLSIFDQTYVSGNKHILEIDESQYPEEYRFITRKLLEAFASKRVREKMQMEDDYLKELLLKEARIAEKDEVIARKDETIAELAARIAELERKLGLTTKTK